MIWNRKLAARWTDRKFWWNQDFWYMFQTWSCSPLDLIWRFWGWGIYLFGGLIQWRSFASCSWSCRRTRRRSLWWEQWRQQRLTVFCTGSRSCTSGFPRSRTCRSAGRPPLAFGKRSFIIINRSPRIAIK